MSAANQKPASTAQEKWYEDPYRNICVMLMYPDSENLYNLLKLCINETQAKMITCFKGDKYPHRERRTLKELADFIGATEEETEESLHDMLLKGFVSKWDDVTYAFDGYGLAGIEGLTDAISYTTQMHHSDPETHHVTDPKWREILDATTKFLEEDWYRFRRVDELVHGHQLDLSGQKMMVYPDVLALEKSGIEPEDYPNPMDWSIKYRVYKAKKLAVAPCPCRSRCQDVDRFPLYTCCTQDMGASEAYTYRLNTEIELGNRIEMTPDEYLENIREGEHMGMIHSGQFCLCHEDTCNVFRPLTLYASMAKGMGRSAFRARVKDASKCENCGKCVKNCRYGAIKNTNGQHEIDVTKCWGCGACVSVCDNNVNELYYTGYEVTEAGFPVIPKEETAAAGN